MSNAKKIALAAADEALAKFNAFRETHLTNGRNLNDLTEDQEREYFALHAAFCEADSKSNEIGEAITVSGLNVGLILRGIDYAAPGGVIEYDGIRIWITGSSVTGSAESLSALAYHLNEACDENLANQQEWRILDNGTEFNEFADKALQRSIKAAERQAKKILAAL